MQECNPRGLWCFVYGRSGSSFGDFLEPEHPPRRASASGSLWKGTVFKMGAQERGELIVQSCPVFIFKESGLSSAFTRSFHQWFPHKEMITSKLSFALLVLTLQEFHTILRAPVDQWQVLNGLKSQLEHRWNFQGVFFNLQKFTWKIKNYSGGFSSSQNVQGNISEIKQILKGIMVFVGRTHM